MKNNKVSVALVHKKFFIKYSILGRRFLKLLAHSASSHLKSVPPTH